MGKLDGQNWVTRMALFRKVVPIEMQVNYHQGSIFEPKKDTSI
jgi:hypothetical protein